MSRYWCAASILIALGAGQAGAQPVQYRSPEGVEYRSLPDTDAIRSARAALAADPKNIARIIDLGVAESGARQFREAIATFTRGLEIEPDNALLLRWRGHRYLSVREFDRAFDDLTRGARLDATVYGIWYHLGVVQFVRGDFAAAATSFARAQPIAPDAAELAGSTDWLWMSLSRAGRGAEAKAMLDRRPDNKPVTNAYTRRLQLYRGEIGPDAVVTAADTDDVQVATLAYGLGNWYLVRGDKTRARTWFERSVQSGGWPAFGFIASEAELRRLPPPAEVPTQTRRIYWGDEVPPGWNGKAPADLLTPAEKTDFTRTTSVIQLHEWIAALKLETENMHVVRMFTSPRGKVAPAIVLGNPRVTSAQQARQSGKPVVFLLGNIHPPEPEAAEALMLLARDLATGKRKALLDSLIVMIAPIYNVDGTDTFVTQDGSLGSETPHILGVRENSSGLDLNRDAVKLTEVESLGLYQTLNAWDPLLFLDGHLMSRVNHGYANTYGTTTVPAAAPGPRDYMHDRLFPAVRDMVRKEFGLEVFSHALPVPNAWPPTGWSHDRAAWTVEAKFIINDYGLRNRFAIITETPGQPTFERRVYAQYAYFVALLEYIAAHGKEMQAVVKAADEKTVADVRAGAESGELKNFLDGEYVSAGKIDLLAYRTNEPAYKPGTSLMSTKPGTASGMPETVRNVDDLTRPVGTRTAWVPRAYVIPSQYPEIAAKLRAHNIAVTTLDKRVAVEGQEFRIDAVRKVRRSGYDMTTLDGAFEDVASREFDAGAFYVDMAQPMANAAFYYLEPQSRDGFVGWWVFDEMLKGAKVYPVFKVRRQK